MDHVIQFRGGPRAVGAARDAVLEHAQSLPTTTMEDLQLLVSEVVTNAVRHGGAADGQTIELRMVEGPETLRIEVTDDGPGFERHRPTPRTDGGWGLFFVDKLASRWNVESPNGRTLVWFEMDVSSPERDGSGAASSRLSA